MTHEKKLEEMLERDKTNPKDYERKAMFYILSGNDDLYSKLDFIYNFAEHNINPECLENSNVDFSGSSQKLIRLAFNLYNGFEADVLGTFQSLDERNIELALKAIGLRFGKELHFS